MRYPSKMDELKMGGLAMTSRFPTRGDQKLIQIVDSAATDATPQRPLAGLAAGAPNVASALRRQSARCARLQRGLADLDKRDPKRAERIRQRAGASLVAAYRPTFQAIPSATSCTCAAKKPTSQFKPTSCQR